MFREEPRQLSQHGWDEEEGEGEPDSPMIYGVVNVNGVNGYSNGEDVESNFQEGIHSRMGDAIPIQSTGMVHEPSPNDAPGPRYESYGSSFGNMGPLPGTFFKTSSKHSRRAPSEDDGATVTQDDQPHVCCPIFTSICLPATDLGSVFISRQKRPPGLVPGLSGVWINLFHRDHNRLFYNLRNLGDP